MKLITYLMPIMVLLGSHEFRGAWYLSWMLTIFRSIFLITLGVMLVILAFRLFPLSIPAYKEVQSVINEVDISLNEIKDPLAEEYKIDPKDVKLIVEKVSENGYKLVAVCGDCSGHFVDENGTKEKGRKIEILSVTPPLMNINIIKLLSHYGYWPFLEVTFRGGPYVISALLVEAAQAPVRSTGMETNSAFTLEDISKARKLIDERIDMVPSASHSQYVWPRRLMGPIQLSCYFLFSIGILNVLFLYFSTVFPNTIIRSFSSVRLDQEKVLTRKSSLGALESCLIEGNVISKDGEAIADEIPVPWLRANRLLGCASSFERFYSKLGSKYQKRMSLLGCNPVIPITEFRRIGYMAMQSSPSGSNVPEFISAQADGMYELYESSNKILQFLVWAIPTLGFVGTVLGIGDAILSTVDLQSSVISVKSLAEGNVGSSIGIAFDTTFVALVLSFVLMPLYLVLQGVQEKMLAYEKRSAIEEIIQPRNVKGSSDEKDLSELIEKLKNFTQSTNSQGELVNEDWRSRDHYQGSGATGLKTMLYLVFFIAAFTIVIGFIPFLSEQFDLVKALI